MMNDSKSAWYYFIKETGINTTSGFNRDSIVDAFILLKDQKKLHNFISNFTKISNLGAGTGKDAKYIVPFYTSKNEALAETALNHILEDNQYDILVGTILYAASKQLQTEINTKHGKSLSSLINNCLSSKQLYLDMKIKINQLEFILAAMENSNFEIGTLNGVGSWDTKKISIYMTK